MHPILCLYSLTILSSSLTQIRRRLRSVSGDAIQHGVWSEHAVFGSYLPPLQLIKWASFGLQWTVRHIKNMMDGSVQHTGRGGLSHVFTGSDSWWNWPCNNLTLPLSLPFILSIPMPHTQEQGFCQKRSVLYTRLPQLQCLPCLCTVFQWVSRTQNVAIHY
jgi:hypothetical protein